MRIITICAAIALMAGPALCLTYDGSLSTETGGLTGTGLWGSGETTLSWTVSTPDSPNDPNYALWTYEYILNVPRGAISHFSIEVSPTFTAENIRDFDGAPKLEGPQWMSSDDGNSNPNLPEAFWGIKWDEVNQGESGRFTLVTNRQPMWGDMYSKSGNAGGQVNTVWNTGLTMPDPLALPSSGSISYHVLVPDTQEGGGNGGDVVPEPLTIVGMLMAVGGVGRYARRRLAV